MNRALLLLVPCALAAAAPAAAQSSEELSQARVTYAARCINCHQPPELSLKTDQAWLDQVHRTN